MKMKMEMEMLVAIVILCDCSSNQRSLVAVPSGIALALIDIATNDRWLPH